MIRINHITKDDFGRISGVILLDKPANITSHDLVNNVRRKINLRKVGHAGTLDPFATGLMIILIGKSTKLADSFVGEDKEYVFDMIIGASTPTLDPESDIDIIKSTKHLSDEKIITAVKSFEGASYQTVPVFSSVKVSGTRLRELAHASDRIEIDDKNSSDTIAKFYLKTGSRHKYQYKKNPVEIILPKKKIKISKVTVNCIKDVSYNQLFKSDKRDLSMKLINVTVNVSKGTYVRQLAKDIGVRLGNFPAMLYQLRRTKIGEFDVKDVYDLKKLVSF
ncbi:MAG: tRNA pseudouridine(55) synthase TruB [Candidatus Dojkabacteria bacterium]|nr:tRNA pseudouridine(55) synthase TruB [Candidatus Dojkabacteria bacterium]